MRTKEEMSEHGTASDLFPGALFRFVDETEWQMVYDTLGCCCGDGPWNCSGCRGEHEVWYGRRPAVPRDKHGYPFGEYRSIKWDGFESPPEVEYIANPTEEETAETLRATQEPAHE